MKIWQLYSLRYFSISSPLKVLCYPGIGEEERILLFAFLLSDYQMLARYQNRQLWQFTCDIQSYKIATKKNHIVLNIYSKLVVLRIMPYKKIHY